MSNHSMTAQESDLPFSHKSVVSVTHEQNIIRSKTRLDSIAHEQTIICRQEAVICKSRGLLSANEKKEKMHEMIIPFVTLS